MALDPERDCQEMVEYDLNAGRDAEKKLQDALRKLDGLQHAVGSIIYAWKQFDDPSLEQRRELYLAYVRAGGTA